MSTIPTRIACAVMSLVGAAGLVAFAAPAVATAPVHATVATAAASLAIAHKG